MNTKIKRGFDSTTLFYKTKEIVAFLDLSGWTDEEIKLYFFVLKSISFHHRFSLDHQKLPGRTVRTEGLDDVPEELKELVGEHCDIERVQRIFVDAGWSDEAAEIARRLYLSIHCSQMQVLHARVWRLRKERELNKEATHA